MIEPLQTDARMKTKVAHEPDYRDNMKMTVILILALISLPMVDAASIHTSTEYVLDGLRIAIERIGIALGMVERTETHDTVPNEDSGRKDVIMDQRMRAAEESIETAESLLESTKPLILSSDNPEKVDDLATISELHIMNSRRQLSSGSYLESLNNSRESIKISNTIISGKAELEI